MQILDQIDLAGPDNSCFAIAGGDLMGGVQIDDVLSPGRAVPVENPIAGCRAKYDAGRWKEPRYGSVRACFGQLDFYVAEVGFAAFICVEIVNAHRLCPLYR